MIAASWCSTSTANAYWTGWTVRAIRRVGALAADLERLWDKYRVSLTTDRREED